MGVSEVRTTPVQHQGVPVPPLMLLSGTVIDPCFLAAGAYLLHGPAVAVRVGEVDEPDVVEGFPLAARA